jgi:hypothetical protein
MQFTRGLALMTVATTALAIACSDANPSQPDLGRVSLGTTGSTDTAKTPTPPTPTPTPKPDTAGHQKASSDPRVFSGAVKGMGPQPDTSKYEPVANATVSLTAPDDSTAGTAGKELARTTSNADGTFTLGSFRPGVYMISVTPPAGSAFAGTHYGFSIGTFAPTTVDLGVWLRRQ